MKPRTWIAASLLLLLAGGVGAGWVRTRDAGQAPTPGQVLTGRRAKRKGAQAPQAPLVDETPLRAAKTLAGLPQTAEEQAYAHQALQLANHEVDLAFADALRRAAEHPPKPTPETKDLFDARDQAQDALESDQRLVAQLTKQLAAAPLERKDSLEDQLDVAKAQLELDQDELDEASEDMERAGLDPQAQIKRAIAAHKVADESQADDEAPSALPFHAQEGSLLARWREWSALRRKVALLDAAQQDAQAKALQLDQQRRDAAKRSAERREARRAAKEKASGFARQGHGGDGDSRSAAKGTLQELKGHMRFQRILTDLGKRAQDERDLAQVYDAWGDTVAWQERASLHGVLERLLWIALVLLGVFVTGLLIDRMAEDERQDLHRAGTLRSVVKVVVQVVGLLVIAFIILGLPAQTTTILGLAGAGLTVALKDFIVAFFGWFVLMGRNGIHVGDWVEIKGVGGEVVEIGLLRTVLLETGSWTDAGHPTGRRVAFVNSFAIEGHFFNFTTSGQWMWDELQVLIPAGQDPYPVIEGLRKLVEQETEANVRQAEQEWQKATTRYRVQAFTATPGLNVIPTSGGIEVRVRYITRAHERHETRKRLYQAVLELMHGRPGGEADPAR
ncbi:MAG TPA: mechanosensitive ion channel domain-containing protein [Holophagaceae bacterium]|nr:mechanosensitive ion channel domain-containing protein [Holophagaceae bacterium]